MHSTTIVSSDESDFSHPMRHIFHEKSHDVLYFTRCSSSSWLLLVVHASNSIPEQFHGMQTNGAQRRGKNHFFRSFTKPISFFLTSLISAVYLANITASPSLFLFATFFLTRRVLDDGPPPFGTCFGPKRDEMKPRSRRILAFDLRSCEKLRNLDR